MMDNWDNMRFLLALYRHKTMSAAAIALQTNVATVSRRIEKASQMAGAPLFVRDASGWVPTEAARPLLRVAEDFDARLNSERNNRALPSGGGIEAKLHIAAPAFFNSVVLVPHLHVLLAQHPRLEVTIRNRSWAMGLGDADIMLRVGRPESGRVVARRLVTLTLRLYRSTQADLQLPGWVAMSSRQLNEEQDALGLRRFGRQPNVVVSLFEQKLMVMRSTGLAGVLADEVAARLTDMVPLDPAGDTGQREIWMIYHATRRDDQAIRAVTDWIIGSFRSGLLSHATLPGELMELAS